MRFQTHAEEDSGGDETTEVLGESGRKGGHAESDDEEGKPHGTDSLEDHVGRNLDQNVDDVECGLGQGEVVLPSHSQILLKSSNSGIANGSSVDEVEAVFNMDDDVRRYLAWVRLMVTSFRGALARMALWRPNSQVEQGKERDQADIQLPPELCFSDRVDVNIVGGPVVRFDIVELTSGSLEVLGLVLSGVGIGEVLLLVFL